MIAVISSSTELARGPQSQLSWFRYFPFKQRTSMRLKAPSPCKYYDPILHSTSALPPKSLTPTPRSSLSPINHPPPPSPQLPAAPHRLARVAILAPSVSYWPGTGPSSPARLSRPASPRVHPSSPAAAPAPSHRVHPSSPAK